MSSGLISLVARLPKNTIDSLKSYELREVDHFCKTEDEKACLYELLKVMHKYEDKLETPGLLTRALTNIVWSTPTTPVEDPMKTGEYQCVSQMHVDDINAGKPVTLQSTRLGTLFSEDGGNTWYDLDKPIRFLALKSIFSRKIPRAYVEFPYVPHNR